MYKRVNTNIKNITNTKKKQFIEKSDTSILDRLEINPNSFPLKNHAEKIQKYI